MKIGLYRPGRSRRPTAALLAAVALGAAALVGAVPGPASADASVTVTYTISANWGFGFQAALTVTPSATVTGGWSLEFDAGDQQALTLAAYAASAQSGRHVTLTNRPFNGTITAGTTLNLIVQFSNPTYSDVPPVGFAFNGQPAAYAPSPYLVVSNAKPTVPEGGTSTVTVRLSQAPASNVGFQVLASSSSASGIAATPGQLSFTPGTWDVPQTVTLASPPDTDTVDQTTVIQVNQSSGYPTFYPSDILLATQLDNG